MHILTDVVSNIKHILFYHFCAFLFIIQRFYSEIEDKTFKDHFNSAVYHRIFKKNSKCIGATAIG